VFLAVAHMVATAVLTQTASSASTGSSDPLSGLVPEVLTFVNTGVIGFLCWGLLTGRIVGKEAHEKLREDKDKEIAQLRADKDEIIKELRDDNDKVEGQRDVAVKAMQELTPHLGAASAALSAIRPVMEENVYELRLLNEPDPPRPPVRRRRRPTTGGSGTSGATRGS
jgi:hypothetical protein